MISKWDDFIKDRWPVLQSLLMTWPLGKIFSIIGTLSGWSLCNSIVEWNIHNNNIAVKKHAISYSIWPKAGVLKTQRVKLDKVFDNILRNPRSKRKTCF